MASIGAKKYDTSKKEEALLYEMEVREEKMRLIEEHEVRRQKYLTYLAEKRESRKMKVWQKAILGTIALSFSLCALMLLCTFHPSAKNWVHDLMAVVLSHKL